MALTDDPGRREELGAAVRAAEDEVGRIKREIEADFRWKLIDGALVATGRDLDGGRREIPPALWYELMLDPPRNAARSGGWRFSDVRVYVPGLQPGPPGAGRAPGPARAAGGDGRGSAPAGTPVARPRGRPSVLDLVRAELHRRAERGKLTGNWSADARDLHQWASVSLQGDRIPNAKSIKRRLRKDYRAVPADKKQG